MEDTKLQIQEAAGYLRQAERNMFSGKNTEAVDMLNKADEINSKVAVLQPDDFQVKSLTQKIEKMRHDLERKGIPTRNDGKKEIPFEVNAQLLRIRDYVINGNLEGAQRELDSYYSRFAGPYTSIPEIRELKDLIEKMEANEAARQRKEAENAELQADKLVNHEKLCGEWRTKLRSIPYFDGHPQNITDLTAHVEAYQKAVQIMNSFGTVTFTMEPDYTLQSMAADIKRRMEMFLPTYNSTLAAISGEISQRIDAFVTHLNSDKTWQDDVTKSPDFIGEQQMKELMNSILEISPGCIDNNKHVFTDLMLKYQRLEELNNERIKARTSANRMKPDVMNGIAAEQLKQKVVATLKETNPDIEILKVVVTQPWETRFEEGWEDNTRTNWIKRSFRETNIQVAARHSDGQHKLISIYASENQTSPGVFGKTNSHIMHIDSIAPENI